MEEVTVEITATELQKQLADTNAKLASLIDADSNRKAVEIVTSDAKVTDFKERATPMIAAVKSMGDDLENVLYSRPYATGLTNQRHYYTDEEKAQLHLFGKAIIAKTEQDRAGFVKYARAISEAAVRSGIITQKQLIETAVPGSLWVYQELLPTYLRARDEGTPYEIFNQVTVTQDTGRLPYELLTPTFTWKGETEKKDVLEPTGSQITWDLNWVAGIALASKDLLEDAYAVNLTQYLLEAFTRGYRKTVWWATASGTGVGEPTGYETCPYTNTTDAQGALNFVDVKQCWLSITDPYRTAPSTAWFMDDLGLEAVLDCVDTVGRPYFGDNTFKDGRYPLIFGRPIYINNSITQGAGSLPIVSTIYLIDTNYYHIFRKPGAGLRVDYSQDAIVTVGSTDYNLFQQNMFAIRFEDRMDMNCSNAAARAEITNVAPMAMPT
jgi:HK97 family phage major capsid protein